MRFRTDLSMDYTIYDTLLGLPLFQGLSKAEFEEVLEKVRFEFRTIRKGQTFIKAGTPCGKFVFILNGSVISSRSTTNGMLTFSETIDSSFLIEPHSLFGIQPSYTRHYKANEDTSLLIIDKQYLYSELYKYEICRMNLMNILSGRIQNIENLIWNMHGMNLEERLGTLVSCLSDIPYGPKEISVKMEDLSQLFGETRLSISKMLNGMAGEGKITLKRGGFTILALENLQKTTKTI